MHVVYHKYWNGTPRLQKMVEKGKILHEHLLILWKFSFNKIID